MHSCFFYQDDFNVEKYLNMFSPSAFDFNAVKMMFDATAPVQFRNDNFNSEVIGLSFSFRHYLWLIESTVN